MLRFSQSPLSGLQMTTFSQGFHMACLQCVLLERHISFSLSSLYKTTDTSGLEPRFRTLWTYLQTIMLEVKSSAYEFSGNIIQFITPCILYSFLFFPFHPSFSFFSFLFLFWMISCGRWRYWQETEEEISGLLLLWKCKNMCIYNSMFIFQM